MTEPEVIEGWRVYEDGAVREFRLGGDAFLEWTHENKTLRVTRGALQVDIPRAVLVRLLELKEPETGQLCSWCNKALGSDGRKLWRTTRRGTVHITCEEEAVRSGKLTAPEKEGNRDE